jgi:RNA polymerase sigma-70 factor (ECF subfamily)
MNPLEFEAWYRAQHPALLTSIALISGRPDFARDAVDEALVRALERWETVRRMDSPGGWTYRVALNLLRRRMRRIAFEARVLRRGAVREPATPPRGEVWDVVAGLPQRQREVVVLRYVADLSQPEIGRVLGIARSTVSSTLTDAHRALAGLLDDHGEMAP